jgi:hypothetical protein
MGRLGEHPRKKEKFIKLFFGWVDLAIRAAREKGVA